VLQGNFLLNPNGIWASFGSVTRYLPTSVIYNLRNLEDVEQLVQDIVSGDMTDIDEANECVGRGRGSGYRAHRYAG
jgi:hypothetical protein